jgi:hypothetical protein
VVKLAAERVGPARNWGNSRGHSLQADDPPAGRNVYFLVPGQRALSIFAENQCTPSSKFLDSSDCASEMRSRGGRYKDAGRAPFRALLRFLEARFVKARDAIECLTVSEMCSRPAIDPFTKLIRRTFRTAPPSYDALERKIGSRRGTSRH